jgi:FMN phosphatase YigB (HAD superfamily)
VKVVFDVGNVLAYASLWWKDAVRQSQLDVKETPLLSQKLYDLPTYLPYEAGRITEKDYLQSLIDEFGLVDLSSAKLLHQSIIQDEVPGAFDFVQFLHGQGIETATLSNNNPIHWEWFTKTGPFPAVQSVKYPIASFELGFHKPEPEIYKALCDKLNWHPAEIILFDDIQANVDAALLQGWRAVKIDPESNIADQFHEGLARNS